jgi:predicted transposase/invertase (TIGR01784 family)
VEGAAMKPGIDPKVDYAFKRVFGSEETKDVLISLLNAVLSPPAGREVVSVTLENPFSEKDTADDKLAILDVKATDARGRLFNVEMQMAAPKAYPQRALYYWAKLYTGQLTASEDFSELRPTISISFLDSRRFPDRVYHHRFRLRDDCGEVALTEDLEIHFVELPKFDLTPDRLTTGLEMWCYFLKYGNELDTEKLPAALDAPPVRRALEVLNVVALNDHERELYEGRIKARRDEEARKKDREEAVDCGIMMMTIWSHQDSLGQPRTPREELSLLSLAELTELAERLKKQAASAKG